MALRGTVADVQTSLKTAQEALDRSQAIDTRYLVISYPYRIAAESAEGASKRRGDEVWVRNPKIKNGGFWRELPEGAKKVADEVSKKAKQAKDSATSAVSKSVEAVNRKLGETEEGRALQKKFADSKEAVSTHLGDAKKWLDEKGAQAQKDLQDLHTKMSEHISSMGKFVDSHKPSMDPDIKKMIGEKWTSLTTGLSSFKDSLGSNATEFKKKVGETLSNLGKKLSEAWDAVKTHFRSKSAKSATDSSASGSSAGAKKDPFAKTMTPQTQSPYASSKKSGSANKGKEAEIKAAAAIQKVADAVQLLADRDNSEFDNSLLGKVVSNLSKTAA